MACRKNAYRGLTEMSEYLEKQKEEQSRQQLELDAEQRKIWTPPSLLERCCLQWLACGPHRMVRSGGNLAAVASRGCSGGCSKEHPKITLDFKEEDGVLGATSSISIALDPFVQFFNELPEATEVTPSKDDYPLKKYQLSGLLSNHHEKLVQKFGAHLVSVEYRALAASKRSYEAQLEDEDMKQAAKKRKVVGEAAPIDLLDKVLEICYNHTLRDHLDMADIAWMRTSCKSMGRIAARMARDRMKAIKLSYTPYIPSWDPDFHGFEMDYPPHRPLAIDNTATATSLGKLHPHEPQKRIKWKYSGNDPSHVMIEIHLEEEHTDIPEKSILFEYTRQLEVAKYLVDSRQFREVGVFKARSNVHESAEERSLEYRVTSCDLDESFLGETSSSGYMVIQSVAFTFNDLLGIFIRLKLYKAKEEYKSSSVKSPADRAYIKALAKAAREAPGNASSFQGMDGWEDVYS